MAIQAQLYQDQTTSGFPMFNQPQWPAGGGYNETWSNAQRQQLLTAPQLQQFHFQGPTTNQTPSFSSSHRNLYASNVETPSFDSVLVDESERLRNLLREQRKRDLLGFLRELETRMSFLLHQKDEEIAKAKVRTSQLESLFVNLQADCLTWQQMAKQNELYVNNLNNTIQLLQQQQCEKMVEDTESCCDEQEQQSCNISKMVCRVCQNKEVGVVVLPCRHMCLCRVCDPVIDFCPVCQTVKNGSVEVLLQ